METDFSGPTLDRKLSDLLREGSDRAKRSRRPVMASLTQPIQKFEPVSLFGATAGTCRHRLLWSQPDSRFSLTGIGAAHVIEASGPRRFSDTAAAWTALCSHALIESDEASPGPVLMGGFSFDTGQPASAAWTGYPEGRMILPRICLTHSGGHCWITINAVLQPQSALDAEISEVIGVLRLLRAECTGDANPPPCARPAMSEPRSSARWRDEVAGAARAVRRDELGKVVLARAVKLKAEHPFDPALALRRLTAGYPTCVVFAVANGERCFLGATPERLLKVCRGEVSTTCLAGSYARGVTEEADRKLADALMADPKERREHAVVLSAMVESLGASCTSLDVPRTPCVLKLPNVQHLCTPISGRLAPDHSALQVVEQLHPTPSVGGHPRDIALRFIREREGLDRGWYAGAIGWVDHRGEGEFAVAIRAALLCGAEATLFAGCGIVAGSDPEREYAESCIKLAPMLAALGAD